MGRAVQLLPGMSPQAVPEGECHRGGRGPEPRLQALARVSLSQVNTWCSNYSPSVQELVEQTEIRLSRVMPALESAQGLDIL